MAFNYIVTIHNKEEMLERVLYHILACSSSDSRIFAVLDGCTDRSEAIVDEISSRFERLQIVKVKTPDVHEILAINAGLRAADQTGEGFNIVLQDDVLLGDVHFESRVAGLYGWGGSQLGFVSFRLGGNFTADAATVSNPVPLCDMVENVHGHGIPNAAMLHSGQFTYRHVTIKSPVCIPFRLVREIGLLDEALAPFMHDDVEYSIRAMKSGYRNGVFGMKFTSKIEWGSTRKHPEPRIGPLQQRNMDYIRRQYFEYLQHLGSHPEDSRVFDVFPSSKEDREREVAEFNRAAAQAHAFQSSRRVVRIIKAPALWLGRRVLAHPLVNRAAKWASKR